MTYWDVRITRSLESNLRIYEDELPTGYENDLISALEERAFYVANKYSWDRIYDSSFEIMAEWEE